MIEFKKKGFVRWNVLNTMQPKRAKSVEKLRKYRKTDKWLKKSSFCVKFDLVCGVQGFILSQNDFAGLHFSSNEVI